MHSCSGRLLYRQCGVAHRACITERHRNRLVAASHNLDFFVSFSYMRFQAFHAPSGNNSFLVNTILKSDVDQQDLFNLGSSCYGVIQTAK